MRLRTATWLASVALGLAACGSVDRRFPLRDPLWRDTDLEPVSVPCRADPTPKDPRHVSCAPEPRPYPLMWDGADNLVFRPLSETVGIVVAGAEAIDVNSLDEVPDSAWFTNRIGVHPMTLREIELGACSPDQLLDGPGAPDGSWIIDRGKMDGSTDGFRVLVPGKGKYLFKADDEDSPEKSSGSQTLGSKVFHAAGYITSCEQVVTFRPSVLKLTPGLRWKHNFGDESAFGAKELERVLGHSPKHDGLVRMQASAWLPGENLGGFRYEGTRADDPSDVVPHEDRRELRGKRLVDAWIDRFDERWGNTIDMWIAARPGSPDASPGHVVHNTLDTSETLGSAWSWEDVSKRLGYSYVFDWGDLAADFFLLGARTNTWDTDQKKPGFEYFEYFNVEDFVPEDWKNEYPVAAFSKMTERDGAWAARILARFTPEIVRDLARTTQYSNPEYTRYLTEVLEGRLEKILRRYLARVSPITGVHVEGASELCAVDLAEWRRLREPSAFRYTATRDGGGPWPVERRGDSELCVHMAHLRLDAGLADDAPARYVRVRITDGVAKGPLVAHLYDLGPTRGYRLAGIERPDE